MLEEFPVPEMCSSVCVFYSMRTETRHVCVPSSATCFTSGLKMGACFNNGIGRLIFKWESVCVWDKRRLIG